MRPRTIALLTLVGLLLAGCGQQMAPALHPTPTPTEPSLIQSVTAFAVPTPFSEPAEIVAGPDGNLWFTESFAHQIGRLNPQTHAITEFVVPSRRHPESITVGPDGNLWFTEQAGMIGRITPGGRLTEFPLPAPFTAPSVITVGANHRLWFLAAQNQSAITSRELLVRFTLPH